MGGSSGGGGGGSGAVSWPAYMQDSHYEALSDSGADSLSASITDKLNAALGASPYAGELAFDPSDSIDELFLYLTSFNSTIGAWNSTTKWQAAITSAYAKLTSIFSESDIARIVSDHTDIVMAELEDTVLPTYRIGMRDLNMVNSSSYAIGEAMILNRTVKEINKTGADLRAYNLKAKWGGTIQGANKILDMDIMQMAWRDSWHKLMYEAERLTIVSSKEFVDKQLEIDVLDGRWDLDTFQYYWNGLASISGGTSATTAGSRPSQAQSSIGGALSGAAAGAMVGSAVPGIGTAVGAGVGAVVGLGASFL